MRFGWFTHKEQRQLALCLADEGFNLAREFCWHAKRNGGSIHLDWRIAALIILGIVGLFIKARIAPGFCRTFRFSVATLVQVVWTPVRGLSCRITPGRLVLDALCNGAVARLFYRVSVTIGPTNRLAMAFVLGMRREREKYQENERRNRLHESPGCEAAT